MDRRVPGRPAHGGRSLSMPSDSHAVRLAPLLVGTARQLEMDFALRPRSPGRRHSRLRPMLLLVSLLGRWLPEQFECVPMEGGQLLLCGVRDLPGHVVNLVEWV